MGNVASSGSVSAGAGGLGASAGAAFNFGLGGLFGIGKNKPAGTPTTPTTTTAVPVNSVPVSTNVPFYLKSSCDNFCVGHYGNDGQTFSNAYTQNGKSFDMFFFDSTSGQLMDSTIGKFCVASQAGGTVTQFQCSGDLDGVGSDSFSQANGQLTFQTNPTFYGCGTSSTTDSTSTGLNYFRVQGNAAVCKACTFSIVTDISQCGSAPAPTTTMVAPKPAVTPAPGCGSGYSSIYWNGASTCYKDCSMKDNTWKACAWGTHCSDCSRSSWACLPPKK